MRRDSNVDAWVGMVPEAPFFSLVSELGYQRADWPEHVITAGTSVARLCAAMSLPEGSSSEDASDLSEQQISVATPSDRARAARFLALANHTSPPDLGLMQVQVADLITPTHEGEQ